MTYTMNHNERLKMKPSIESVSKAQEVMDEINSFGYQIDGEFCENAIAEALDEARQQGRSEMREEAAKCAERLAKEIIDMQTGLRSNPALEVATQIRRLN